MPVRGEADRLALHVLRHRRNELGGVYEGPFCVCTADSQDCPLLCQVYLRHLIFPVDLPLLILDMSRGRRINDARRQHVHRRRLLFTMLLILPIYILMGLLVWVHYSNSVQSRLYAIEIWLPLVYVLLTMVRR